MRRGHVAVFVDGVVERDLPPSEFGEVRGALRLLRMATRGELDEGEAGARVREALVLALWENEFFDLAVLAEEFLQLLLLGLKRGRVNSRGFKGKMFQVHPSNSQPMLENFRVLGVQSFAKFLTAERAYSSIE